MNLPAIAGGNPIRPNRLVFGRPYVDQSIIDAVIDCLHSGWWSTGPRVSKLEERIKEIDGAAHAIAVSSCSAGLHLALLVAGIGTGDEVVTSPVTFAATANAIAHVGAKPVFADIDLETGNLDLDAIEARITNKTRAIIVVHLGGSPCDMRAFSALAKAHNLLLVEDAAHAFNINQDVMGDIKVYSFYVTKNVAGGEGGMLITNKSDWADRLRILSQSGIDRTAWHRFSGVNKDYSVIEPGYKYNMTDLQASIILAQLDQYDELQAVRRQLWDIYDKELASTSLIGPKRVDGHMLHLYSIKVVENRDLFRAALVADNIDTGIHYRPLHLEPAYHSPHVLPNAEVYGNITLSLPLSANMSVNDAHDVVAAIKRLDKHRLTG